MNMEALEFIELADWQDYLDSFSYAEIFVDTSSEN